MKFRVTEASHIFNWLIKVRESIRFSVSVAPLLHKCNHAPRTAKTKPPILKHVTAAWTLWSDQQRFFEILFLYFPNLAFPEIHPEISIYLGYFLNKRLLIWHPLISRCDTSAHFPRFDFYTIRLEKISKHFYIGKIWWQIHRNEFN